MNISIYNHKTEEGRNLENVKSVTQAKGKELKMIVDVNIPANEEIYLITFNKFTPNSLDGVHLVVPFNDVSIHILPSFNTPTL